MTIKEPEDQAKLWWEVQKDVIAYQKAHGVVDGVSADVVGQAFDHWYRGKDPKWNRETDIRSYLFGIAKKIMDKQIIERTL